MGLFSNRINRDPVLHVSSGGKVQLLTMDDHRLSIPVCHSPGGIRNSSSIHRSGGGSSRRSPKEVNNQQQGSFSNSARSVMERADYWDDLGIKTGMEMAFGLPDPEAEAAWQEVLEEEKPEEWGSVCMHFTQNTTFHGINKITESTPFPIRRVIWVLIVLGGLTLFMSQMVRSVLLYLEYPVTVNTRIVYNKTISFPAVTICNQNVFRISRAANAGHYLLIDRIYRQSLYKMNLTEIAHDTSCSDAPNVTLKTLLDETAHDKYDMIAMCMWDGVPCSADDFVTTITDHGVCFTFNSGLNGSFKTAGRTGSEGGLRLKLNIEQYEYMRGPNSAAGIKILAHDQTEIPLVRDFGQAVSPGSHAFLGVTMTEMNNLKKPHGECQAEMELDFFHNYNIPNCQVECLANFLRARCDCRLVYMPALSVSPGQPPHCTFRQFENCVIPKMKLFELHQRGPDKCNCPSPCARRKYETAISYGKMSNFDTEIQGRNMENESQIRQSFVAALETTQQVDEFIASVDTTLAHNLSAAACSIDGIFDQIAVKMENITRFVNEMYHELSNRTFFHKKYGLEAVQKSLQYGYVQVWDIDQQHVFVPLLSGAKQLLIRYRKAIQKLVNDSESEEESSSHKAFRDMLVWTQQEQLSSRLDMALRTRDSIEAVYSGIVEGEPLLHYDWAIDDRYLLVMVPKDLLQHNVYYLDIMYNYMLNEVNSTIRLTKKLRHMLRRAYHKHEWNESYFHEVRRNYTSHVEMLSYGHNTFKTAVFGKMEALINKEIAEFTKLSETMVKEKKDVGITIQNFHQLVQTMKVDVWPAIVDTVKLSIRYVDQRDINKTLLAAEVTSEDIDARLKQMADVFIDVRARARNLDHDWLKFRDALIAVWSSIKIQSNTQNFYSKLNKDFREIILKKPKKQDNFTLSDTQQALLEPFRQKLGSEPPELLFKWTNADLPEKQFKPYVDHIKDQFETFMDDVGILHGVNEKDDKFFNVFRKWKNSLQKFLDDSEMNDKFIKENFLKIDVYMTELYYQIVEQREAYDLTNLWSDIGGSMGLFVGASVITVFELIDAMLHNFLKVQLQETKQRRRSMAVMKSQSMRQNDAQKKKQVQNAKVAIRQPV